ncbi:hypothetical protein XAUC_17490 [Xanthomonas citri pv. aurantifolii str. ICPB 10535]|nr:hypothetical protein XAUC_17490 [Xanthomonas citri pv. aurantifolii str. ICPB 10535]
MSRMWCHHFRIRRTWSGWNFAHRIVHVREATAIATLALTLQVAGLFKLGKEGVQAIAAGSDAGAIRLLAQAFDVYLPVVGLAEQVDKQTSGGPRETAVFADRFGQDVVVRFRAWRTNDAHCCPPSSSSLRTAMRYPHLPSPQ